MTVTDWAERVMPLLATALAAIAAFWDVRERRIPNWLTFPAAAVGLLLGMLSGWQGFVFSARGLVVGLALLMIPYLMQGQGAGDVKLLAALGSFVGGLQVTRLLLLGLLCYPLIALFFVLRERKLELTLRRFVILFLKLAGMMFTPARLRAEQLALTDNPDEASVGTPFSLAVCAGILLALHTNYFQIRW
jgi:prepilin peptidase CpaA